MALSVDQVLEENIFTERMCCTSVIYSQYKILETEQGTAIIGCPTNGARIQRNQLLACEEMDRIRNCVNNPFDLHEIEKNIVEKEFEKWASANGQKLKKIEESQPHTLLRLMRLEERNRAQSIDIRFLTEGLLFNKISSKYVGQVTKSALKYCENHGFPLGGIIESKNGNLYYGCTIDALYFLAPNGLNHLFNRYMAWRYLQLNDTEAKKQCLLLGGEPPLSEHDYKRIVVGWQPISIGVQPVYNNGVPELLNLCDSQLDMAAIQLTHIIARGDHYMENGRILYCKGCGQLFLSTHGSRQYCDKCKTNSTARVHVKRNKDRHTDKEGSNNAGKNETR